MVRCSCGRLHPSWNPGKLCNACSRERMSSAGDEVHAVVVELERRRLNPSPAERAEDLARFAGIHSRWLERQSLDHPWRVAVGGGEA